MASSQVEAFAPLAIPLPEGPEDKYFTDAQWTTLLAILDTVIPSITRDASTSHQINQITISDKEYNDAMDHIKANIVNPPSTELLDKYLQECPSKSLRYQELLRRSLVVHSRDAPKKGLRVVLAALK